MNMEPGQLFLKEEAIICNEGRTAFKVISHKYRRSSRPNRITFSFF